MSGRSWARHSRRPTPPCVTEIYAAREEPVAGVSGKLVVDRLAEARPGMPVGWAPALGDAARLAASLARPGGVVLTIGAGDVDGAIPLLQDALTPMTENVPLCRYTTLGTGGPARWFAEPRAWRSSSSSSTGRASEGLPVAAVGLGSNLLVADEGFPGLALKLAGVLAKAKVGDGRLVAGGGAPLAVCLHRARAAELGGLEFVCAIPGTVGGGVWMNAGAYGGDIAGVLVRALVADAEGTRWLTPAELGLRVPRARSSGAGRSSPAPSFASSRGRTRRSRRPSPRCRRSARRRSPRTSERSGASSRTPTTS